MRKPWKQLDAFSQSDLFAPMNWQQDGAQMSLWGTIKSHVQTCLSLVGGFVRKQAAAPIEHPASSLPACLPAWKRLALRLLWIDLKPMNGVDLSISNG